MSSGLTVLLMTLAAYRLARLLVHDTFPPIAWLRDKFTGPYEVHVDTAPRKPTHVPFWFAYLWTCTWCMTVWTAAGVTVLTWVTIDLPAPLLIWGGVAAGAALLSHLEDFFTRPDNEE